MRPRVRVHQCVVPVAAAVGLVRAYRNVGGSERLSERQAGGLGVEGPRGGVFFTEGGRACVCVCVFHPLTWLSL